MTVRHLNGSLVGALLLAALGALTSGCERPFVPEARPEIELQTPADLSVVRTAAALRLVVSTSSLRPVLSVTANDAPLRPSEQGSTWAGELMLYVGLNAIALEATDERGGVGRDTLYAAYVPLQITPAAFSLPQSVGGQASTLLSDGTVLITGGTRSTDQPAQQRAYRYDFSDSPRPISVPSLLHARTGHTGTLLPDGSVLILGGATRDIPEAADFVSAIERYDPAGGEIVEVPYSGPPVRRALHTALVYTIAGNTYVFVAGGLGESRTGEAAVSPRADMLRFQLRNDSLIALDGAAGPLLFNDPSYGHTQTELPATPGVPRYLFAGYSFERSAVFANFFLFDIYGLRQFDYLDRAGLREPRIRHAAAPLGDDLILFLGGHGASPGEIVSTSELYAPAVNRYFRFTTAGSAVRRFGQTATKLRDGRILTVGGFSADGSATDAVAFVSFNSDS